jgi:ABC-type transport system involved in multi-copper enzyme maturation permease subunit
MAFFDNAIVRRELRGLRYRLRDWRLWVGTRLPGEAREWGLPALTWFSIHPYACWVLLTLMERIEPRNAQLLRSFGVDLFEIILIALVFYTCAISVVIGATTITRERERQTWEQVLATPLTNWELVLGYWLARCLPLMIGAAVATLAWGVLYPHYSRLLTPLGAFSMSWGRVSAAGLGLFAEVAAFTAMGLMFSTCCRRQSVAVALALATFGGIVALCVAGLPWTDRGPGPLEYLDLIWLLAPPIGLPSLLIAINQIRRA